MFERPVLAVAGGDPFVDLPDTERLPRDVLPGARLEHRHGCRAAGHRDRTPGSFPHGLTHRGGDQFGAASGRGPFVRQRLELNRDGIRRPVHQDGFSTCPPNSLRIADRTLLAKSASPRDEKRDASADVNTGVGTPVSIAATAVHRPSPESLTRPAKPSSVGASCNAAAVRSSSHELTTLPRRQTSATSATSIE